jgi:hypothetical protein
VKISIPAKLAFHDPQLSSFAINNFDLDYSEICLDNHQKLMDGCGGVFYGKFVVNLIFSKGFGV